jgi:transposase
MDRKRTKKASNQDWEHSDDPDARIAKMKDGSTHLAHKVEHAVDMETGAILAVTLQGADTGDTTTIQETLITAADQVEELAADPKTSCHLRDNILSEVVADKGYHSNAMMADLAHLGIRSYVSEPKRGRRNWAGKAEERDAVYANRRRIRGERGRALMRRRGLMLERPFAHCYETGGMRRVHLRGRDNILKRLLIHVGGYNLSLVLRATIGKGTPRGLQDLAILSLAAFIVLVADYSELLIASIPFQTKRNPGLFHNSFPSRFTRFSRNQHF